MKIKKISNLIEQIYESALSGDWLDILNMIQVETDSNKVFFLIRDVAQDKVIDTHLVANFTYDATLATGFLDNFEQDPWYHHAQAALEGEITRPSVEVPVETFKSSAIYQNYFLPLRTHYCVGAILIRDQQYESFLICNRDQEATEYSQAEIEFIELLMPHFRQAVRIYLTLQTYKKVLCISEAINNSSEAGVVLCDENCNILEINSFAKRIISDNDAFVCENGKLALSKDYLNATLEHHVKECAHFNDNRLSLQHDIYVENAANDAFVLNVLPLTRVDASIHTQYASIIKINTQKQVRWQSIQHEFALTPKELFVTKLIFDKHTTQQIAQELNIQLSTARTHIQNLYKKIEVNSQVELMAKLSLYSR